MKNFLSEEECDHIISISKNRMKKSTVVDVRTGSSVPSEVRTSTGTFFDKHHDEIIKRIEAKVAEVSMVPEGRSTIGRN